MKTAEARQAAPGAAGPFPELEYELVEIEEIFVALADLAEVAGPRGDVPGSAVNVMAWAGQCYAAQLRKKLVAVLARESQREAAA